MDMIFNTEVSMEEAIRQFKELYNDVIDANGNVKACGRDKCIKLIQLAKSINVRGQFGNIKTGYMKVDNIIELYNKLA